MNWSNKKGGVADGIVVVVVLMSLVFVIVIASTAYNVQFRNQNILKGDVDESLFSRNLLLFYASSPACETLPNGLTYADALVLVVGDLNPNLIYSESFYEPPLINKIWDNGLQDALIASWYYCTTSFFQKSVPSTWTSQQNTEYNQRFNLVIKDEEKTLLNFAGRDAGWSVEASILISTKEGPLTLELLSKRDARSLGGVS